MVHLTYRHIAELLLKWNEKSRELSTNFLTIHSIGRTCDSSFIEQSDRQLVKHLKCCL